MAPRRRAAVGVALVLAVAACGDGDGGDDGDGVAAVGADAVPTSVPTSDRDTVVPEPPTAGGFGDNPAIPGADGTITRESITLTVDGATATLAVDVAFTGAVEYLDGAPVCFDDFTFTSGRSDLTVDRTSVSGTTELILDHDGATRCPDSVQDDIGVPVTVDVTGDIEGALFQGELSIDGFAIPFTAPVVG